MAQAKDTSAGTATAAWGVLSRPTASNAELCAWVRDARQRTIDLTADLSDAQLMGPRLAIVNPLLWEIGHVAWFQEKWVLRGAAGERPIRADGDALYDSAAIPHDTRWDLPLPSREETLAYMRAVRGRVIERIERGMANDTERYFVCLSVFHEDMHTEAFTYTRQTLGYPPPTFSLGEQAGASDASAGPLLGDVEIPGGRFLLGALPSEPFVFDNEKWAHLVEIKPFAIARAAVTQAEFAAFVQDRGYRRRELWSEEGWGWRESERAEQPLYWKDEGSGWLRRHFSRWVPLEPHRAVLHINWWEAQAYCRWAGRRLPTEAEWEVAAAAEPAAGGRALAETKRRFPWGNDPPTPDRANLAWRARGAVDVGAHPAGDSAFGCRQMVGNVWEWTSDDFRPYPGFVRDPYKEYSEPWFGTHKVLRGGAWPTQPRLLRNTWRDFYMPHRRDVWAGFRTCRRD
jgi:iron(II)-dependent oxidoreductase